MLLNFALTVANTVLRQPEADHIPKEDAPAFNLIVEMSALVEDICNKCSSIIEKIAATRVIVQESSRRNREARVDLGDLSRQLSDLSDVLNYWKYDAVQSDAATNVVAIVSPRLGRILQHCLEVLSDVDSFAGVVEGLESWSDHMKLEIDTLYKLLDAYTLFLQVSLDMLYL